MQKLLLSLALAAGLVSCGGGDDPALDPSDPAVACSVGAQRATIADWVDDQYYWYNGLSLPHGDAPDMGTWFRSMLPVPPDRYSFAQSTASFDQVFTGGWRVGFGYTLTWDDTQAQLRVRQVEPESPADSSGLRRGDRIVTIDGYTPQQVMAGVLPAVSTAGVVRVFVVKDAAGTQRTLSVKSGLVRITPLATWATLDATRDGQPVKVGYLAYHQFVQYSEWQLAIATSRMAAQGVSEVVLDLRYNGGGIVSTSRNLASMISGSRTDGAPYALMRFNDKHPEQNQDMLFMTAQQRYTAPIEGLKRVFVITSGSTASASELLINGLKPYMQVVLVGERTYGKPYGFVPKSVCGTTYNAVNFEAFNALGEGGYSAGIDVDCAVKDDLDHQLGDTQERRLKEALAYIASGRCSAQAPQAARLDAGESPRAAPRVYGETTEPQMFLR